MLSLLQKLKGEKIMIGTILYTIIMLIISVLLFALKFTGMKIHIVLGILACIITIVYTLLIRKEIKEYSKKSIVIEVAMRVFLAIALITGFLLKPFGTIVFISIIHKASAVVFAILLLLVNIKKIFIKQN